MFVNPIAGRGRAGELAARITAQLERELISVRVFNQPAYSVSDSDLKTDATAAIVIGGDGTLRAAVERLMWHAKWDGSRVPPVLVVPLGTANLMARHLGMHWDDKRTDEQVAAAILNPRVVQLDAARANERLFLLMAGVGIDAAIVHELDRLRSGPIDLLSYVTPALLSLGQYAYPPLTVQIDGQIVLKNEPAMAFVGNVQEYGTGFPILTHARSDDKLLDICILPCHSRAEVLRLLMAAATGDHVNQEGVIYTKGRSVRIESSASAPVQIDGEASGHTPLNIDLLPSRVPFIVPQLSGQ